MGTFSADDTLAAYEDERMKETRIALWYFAGLLLIAGSPRFCRADDFPGPTDAKAQKTFAEADKKLKEHKRADALEAFKKAEDRKSTRLNSSHCVTSRMPSSA